MRVSNALTTMPPGQTNPEICSRINRQTHRHAHHSTPLSDRERSNNDNNHDDDKFVVFIIAWLACELVSVPVLWRSRRGLAEWWNSCPGWLETCRPDSSLPPAGSPTPPDTGYKLHITVHQLIWSILTFGKTKQVSAVADEPARCAAWRVSCCIALNWPSSSVGQTSIITSIVNLIVRVVGCWCGCLSGTRCRLAYGPADATATHCLLLQ